MQCGLLGRKLGHSYSPQIHACLSDYDYTLFELEPDSLADFLKNGQFNGLNVTIPYKKEVIPYCDELSPAARKLGAVNTLVRKDGRLIGHNTDYFGFLTMVKASGLNVSGKKVLVLGSGGASTTVVAVLESLNANAIVISRNGENNYTNLNLHSDASIIVNTTPVGMYPNNGDSPIKLDLFPQLEGVLDLIYNPARTKLLLDAEARKIVAMNGLLMLVAQAKESAEWFTGNKIADSIITQIYNKLRFQMTNIILVGMPGCGKTTIGKILAQKLNRPFIDADAEIVRASGKTVPEIFAESGETGFRKIETQVLTELGKESGKIIATGGGCVTVPENYPLLHQNGNIIWIQRELFLLATEERPLSEKSRLASMYEVRESLYRDFSDYIIKNDCSPETAAERILSVYTEDTMR